MIIKFQNKIIQTNGVVCIKLEDATISFYSNNEDMASYIDVDDYDDGWYAISNNKKYKHYDHKDIRHLQWDVACKIYHKIWDLLCQNATCYDVDADIQPFIDDAIKEFEAEIAEYYTDDDDEEDDEDLFDLEDDEEKKTDKGDEENE